MPDVVLAPVKNRESLLIPNSNNLNHSMDAAEILKESVSEMKKKDVKVHFASDDKLVSYRPTIYKGDLTPEEYYLYWFTKAESTLSKNRDQEVLQELEKSGKEIPRGLENRTEAGNTRHEINKIKGRLVVEEEMTRVRDLPKEYREENADELAEYLSQIYANVSKDCKQSAYELALKDAKDAKKVVEAMAAEEEEGEEQKLDTVPSSSVPSPVDKVKKKKGLKKLFGLGSK